MHICHALKQASLSFFVSKPRSSKKNATVVDFQINCHTLLASNQGRRKIYSLFFKSTIAVSCLQYLYSETF